MKPLSILLNVFRGLRIVAGSQARQPPSESIADPCDPHAEGFLTLIDGKPVTFVQFNARMQNHFHATPPKGGRYE